MPNQRNRNKKSPATRIYHMAPNGETISAVPLDPDNATSPPKDGIKKLQLYDKNKTIPDFIAKRGLEGTWTVNQSLKEKIADRFDIKLTWTPVEIEGIKYWTIEPEVMTDIIDLNLSTLSYSPRGTLDQISRISFIKKSVDNLPPIFEHDKTGGLVFCTDEFAEWVISENLTGVQFFLTWQDGIQVFSTYPSQDEVCSRPDVFGPEGLQPRRLDWWPDEWLQQVAKGHPVYREARKEIRARIRRAERVAKAPKRVVVVEPLSTEERDDMDEFLAEGRQRLNLLASTPPLECADAVMDYIRQARIERLDPANRRVGQTEVYEDDQEMLELTAVFSDAWNRHFGWNWVNLTLIKDQTMSVLGNPDSSLYIHAGLHIRLAMTQWGAPFKGRLAWSMLDKGDEIPPQPPGQMLDLLDSLHFVLPPV